MRLWIKKRACNAGGEPADALCSELASTVIAQHVPNTLDQHAPAQSAAFISANLRAAPADISAPGPAQPGHNSAGLGQLNQAVVPSDIQQLNSFVAKWLSSQQIMELEQQSGASLSYYACAQ